jgi:type IV secretion system protein TrbD
MQIRGTPAIYFKSLNRPFNILGVDRQLFFLFVGLCLPIAFSARLKLVADGIAFLMFIIMHVAGVLVTRADNNMLAIYRRHIHYKKYYAAHAGIHSRLPLLRPSVPVYQGKRGLV